MYDTIKAMTKPTHNLSPATLRQRRSRARKGAPIFCCLRCGASGTTLARDPHDRLLCAACGHELAAAGVVRCRDCNTFTPIAACAPKTQRCRPCHKARQRAAQRAYRARRLANTAPLSQTGLVAAVDPTPTTSNEPISKGINETNSIHKTNDEQGGRRSDDDAQAGLQPEPAPEGNL